MNTARHTGRDEMRSEDRTLSARLRPLLIELWMAGILAGFFVVRILGSQTGQRILSGLLHHTRP